jgi:hypothetical protein
LTLLLCTLQELHYLKLMELQRLQMAGAYDLGSFDAAGTTEKFSVVIKNTGEQVLTISSVSFTGDVLSFDLPNFAGVVYPRSINYFKWNS